MILDHVGIAVSNYDRSKQFYTRVLKPLDIMATAEHNGWVGFGKNGKNDFFSLGILCILY